MYDTLTKAKRAATRSLGKYATALVFAFDTGDGVLYDFAPACDDIDYTTRWGARVSGIPHTLVAYRDLGVWSDVPQEVKAPRSHPVTVKKLGAADETI